MFKEAGLARPPQSFDEHPRAAADKMTSGEKTGFLTLNFDWLYWPLMQMNGVELLTPDLKKAAFNTPKAVEVGRRSWPRRRQSGAINKISWTGRWVEPNGAFAAGNVGMLHAHSPAYFFVKGQGPVGQRATRWARRRCPATGRRRTATASASPRARRTPSWPGTS